ncbi:MAG: CoA transferase, partial [Pseudomonadota bacterium]
YQAFRARDTHFVLAAGNDKLWASVCDVIDRPELTEHPDYLTTTDRARNQTQLKALLENTFAGEDAAEWIHRLRERGVPCEPINAYQEALQDPQVAHSGWVTDLTLPSGAVTQTFGFPALINGQNAPIYRAPPTLGEHTEEVLQELASGDVTKAQQPASP